MKKMTNKNKPTLETIHTRRSDNCHLEIEIIKDPEGKPVATMLYCCDSKDRYPTYNLVNPSEECIKCMAEFMEQLILEGNTGYAKE